MTLILQFCIDWINECTIVADGLRDPAQLVLSLVPQTEQAIVPISMIPHPAEVAIALLRL